MPYVLHHFSRSLDFDPERLSAMGEAYDRSVRSFSKLPSRPVREAIASHIIVLAERGVADSAILCRAALAAFRDAQNERG
jgi:hypothetical protein